MKPAIKTEDESLVFIVPKEMNPQTSKHGKKLRQAVVAQSGQAAWQTSPPKKELFLRKKLECATDDGVWRAPFLG